MRTGLPFDVLDADLALAVGTQEIEFAAAANFAQALHQLVRQHDRQRHQFRSLVAGIAEHQALVAGAAGVHTHGDVGRLRLNHVEDTASLRIEAICRVREADVGDHFARQLRNVDIGRGGDFARHDAGTRGYKHLTSHAASGIVLQNRVQNRVRNLVCHLIGMAFGN